MKYIILLFVSAIFLAGCAHEAYYADNEYGIASTDAYDRQIVHKDYVYADKNVDGLEGLHAEPTMQMYHDSFGEGFTQETVDTLSPGKAD
jgi:PBP1b-binding outer membrane lipoprotein LpoB